MNNYENGTSSLIMQIYEKKEGKERNKISYPGTGVPRGFDPGSFFPELFFPDHPHQKYDHVKEGAEEVIVTKIPMPGPFH